MSRVRNLACISETNDLLETWVYVIFGTNIFMPCVYIGFLWIENYWCCRQNFCHTILKRDLNENFVGRKRSLLRLQLQGRQ